MPASRTSAVACAVVSGVLLWASAPPVRLDWLAWFALVPAASFALARPRSRWGRAVVPLAVVVYLELLLVPALPFGLAENQWGEPFLPVLIGGSPVLVVALLLVPLAGLALYALRFPQPLPTTRPWSVGTALALVAVPAAVWTAFDLVRTKFDPGGFWGPLFLSQHGTAASRLAALAGPWLVTFALVAVNYTLAVALVGAPRRRVAFAPAALALVLVLPAFVPGGRADGAAVAVAAVQPGYDTAEFERPVLRYLRRATRDLERASVDLTRDLAPLTREAAARGAEIVVWPEATVWVDPHENRRVRTELARLASATGVVLVVPYFLRSEAHGAAVVVRADGSLTRAQPKQRPMWFLGERSANRVPPAPVDTGTASVGTLLGVDTQDPAGPRRLAGRGADVLASSTHDWRALAVQQRALARFHARGVRTPLVRADWRYGSAIVDADGRVVADAGLEKRRTVVVADVATGAPTTAYSRVGDAFGWGSLAALAPLLVAARRLGSGRERTETERPAHALAESELPAHPRS